MGVIKKIKLIFILFPLILLSQDANDKLPILYTVDTLIHKVERKQNLYSISKMYNITIEDIKKYNPEIKGSRLSRRMLLYIPVMKKTKTSITTSTQKYDSLSFLNDKLEIKNVNLIDSIFKKKSINIAFLAPFKLDLIDLDSIENTKLFLKKLNLSTISLDFYSGAMLALDKVKELGINISMDVNDTKNDSEAISIILKNKQIQDYDFVLGPLIPRNVIQFSSESVKSKTPIISPLSTKRIKIINNVVQSMPSKQDQRNKMLSYVDSLIIENPNPCVMIIYDNKSESIKDKIIKKFPYAELINTDNNNGYVDPEITDSLLVTAKKNFVFLESENLNTITSVSSLLNSQISNERDIYMMTTYRSDIYENENISFEHLGNLNFTYPSYYLPVFDSEKINLFNTVYLEKFGRRPNKIAIRGYDITLDLILRVATKKKFIKSVEIGETSYLQNKFNYSSNNKGFINKSIYLIKHDKLKIMEIKN